jgi:lipopolysaccharide export system permease protein
MNKIQSHLFNQVLRAAALIVGGLVLMALLAQGLSRTDVILESRQSVFTYFYVVMLGAPQIVALLTPLALFIASVWSLNRIHKDSEIVVAQAAGMTRWQVASPIIRLAVLCAVAHLAVNLWVQPLAQRAMRTSVAEARADLASALIRPGQFTTNGERLTFYAREQVGGELRGVLISDMTDPQFPTDILARSAALIEYDGEPTLLLRDAITQQLDDRMQLSVLEFEEYMFPLKDYMKEDSSLNLKASDKFLHELFFIDRTNYFELKDADTLLAEGHARLTTPLLSFVMSLIAIVAVLGGDFSRRGYNQRIAWGSAGALLALAIQISLQSASADDPELNVAQWIVPLLTIIVLSWVYFAKGRHIGSKEVRRLVSAPLEARSRA